MLQRNLCHALTILCIMTPLIGMEKEQQPTSALPTLKTLSLDCITKHIIETAKESPCDAMNIGCFEPEVPEDFREMIKQTTQIKAAQFLNTTTLSGHTDWVRAVIHDPINNRIFSASDDKTIKVWDLDTNTCIRTFRGHRGWIRSIEYDLESNRLFSADDRTLKMWNLDTGEILIDLSSGADYVGNFTYDAQQNLLFIALNDKRFSPEPEESNNNQIIVWDIDANHCVHTLVTKHTLPITDLIFDSINARLFTASMDKTIEIWDLTTNTCIHKLRGHSKDVDHLLYDAPHNRLFSASGEIKVWHLNTGNCISTLSRYTGLLSKIINSDCINHLAYDPKNNQLFTASGDGKIKIWDLATGVRINTLTGHTSYALHVVHDSEHNRLFTASGDGKIKIWQHGSFAYTLCSLALDNIKELNTLQRAKAIFNVSSMLSKLSLSKLSDLEKQDIEYKLQEIEKDRNNDCSIM